MLQTFSRRFNDERGTSVAFSTEAVDVLSNYTFPGNVRELLNVVERSITLANSQLVQATDLPPHIAKIRQKKTSLASLQEIVAAAEKHHILKIVQLTQGNRSRAAEIIGISRKTLWEKINAHKLDL